MLSYDVHDCQHPLESRLIFVLISNPHIPILIRSPYMVQSGNVFILFDSGTVIINGYKYGA